MTQSAEWQETAHASAEAQDTSEVFVGKLTCVLTEHELAERGAQLAALQRTIAEVEADKKSAMASFKKKLDVLGSEAERVGTVIIDKSEERDVKCTRSCLYSTGMVRIVRLDTGEVIQEHAMSAAERQTSLFSVPDVEDVTVSSPGRLPCTVTFGASWQEAKAADEAGDITDPEAVLGDDEEVASDFDGNPPPVEGDES